MTAPEIWEELRGQAGALFISALIIWAFVYGRIVPRKTVDELQAAWQKTFDVFRQQVERERTDSAAREATKDRLLQLSHDEMIQTSKIQSRLVELSLGQRQEAEDIRRSSRRSGSDEDERGR